MTTTIPSTPVDQRAALLTAGARVVANAIAADAHTPQLFDLWSIILVITTHPGWPAHESSRDDQLAELAELTDSYLRSLLADPTDTAALWALLHHPGARPCAADYDAHAGIRPARVEGLTVCQDCAAGLARQGCLAEYREKPATEAAPIAAGAS